MAINSKSKTVYKKKQFLSLLLMIATISLLITDVTHKIDAVDKVPKFVHQLILNFECVIIE